MRMPTILYRKKLRASTARRQRTLGLPDEMDYEQMAEPNMKLSRALLIVLVLHVVAVAGIIAFNTIKTRQITALPAGEPAAASRATLAPSAAPVAPRAAEAPNESPAPVARAESSPAVKAAERVKAVPPALPVADSGKIYVVARGDNPVTIARKLHVSYDALLALNAIEDPRKLQIGQKLRVPERVTKPKHRTEEQ